MADGPGFTALVVEDEPLIALDTEDMLRAMGASEVAIADDFEAARAQVRGGRYGVVLFDLDLSGVSTVPLIEACVADGGKAVVLSGTDDLPDALEGTIRILTKPVSQTALRGALGEAGVPVGAC